MNNHPCTSDSAGAPRRLGRSKFNLVTEKVVLTARIGLELPNSHPNDLTSGQELLIFDSTRSSRHLHSHTRKPYEVDQTSVVVACHYTPLHETGRGNALPQGSRRLAKLCRLHSKKHKPNELQYHKFLLYLWGPFLLVNGSIPSPRNTASGNCSISKRPFSKMRRL